jgi:hypothetical protein
MRSRKTQTKAKIAPIVRTKNCPLCKLGQLVHKNDAYFAYQSNYYSQQRREIERTKNLKPKPTVGQYLHIEKVLLSPKFQKKFEPASSQKFYSISESKWSTYAAGIFGATLMLFLTFYLENIGEDMSRHSPASAAVLLFGLILIILITLIIERFDSFREKQFMKSNLNSLNSWLCLRCNTHLAFNTSTDGKPVIYLLD